jgi:antitoxin component YwqK of YwqJK toxin-antitoxin module
MFTLPLKQLQMNKKLIITIILGMFVTISNAQKSDTIYYDKYWCESKKTDAVYYRTWSTNIDSKMIDVKDYFLSTHQLQMSGSYKNNKFKKKEGLFTWYHANGNKKIEVNYVKNKRNGSYIKWYSSQKIKDQGEYKKGRRTGVWKYFFKNGQISGEVNYLEKYEKYWNEDGSEMPYLKQSYRRPEYPGGWEAFWEDYYKINKQKIVLCDKNNECFVDIILIIDEEGNMIPESILNHPHPIIKAEVLRTLSLMKKKWLPSKIANRITRRTVRLKAY